MAITGFTISAQPANPAVAIVHPCGLQMPLVAEEMSAATSTSLICVTLVVPFLRFLFPITHS